MRRRVRHVDGVELVVAGRRLHDPRGAGDDADDLERLVPERDRLADRIRAGAEQLLGDDLTEHQHLLGASPARAR